MWRRLGDRERMRAMSELALARGDPQGSVAARVASTRNVLIAGPAHGLNEGVHRAPKSVACPSSIRHGGLGITSGIPVHGLGVEL